MWVSVSSVVEFPGAGSSRMRTNNSELNEKSIESRSIESRDCCLNHSTGNVGLSNTHQQQERMKNLASYQREEIHKYTSTQLQRREYSNTE